MEEFVQAGPAPDGRPAVLRRVFAIYHYITQIIQWYGTFRRRARPPLWSVAGPPAPRHTSAPNFFTTSSLSRGGRPRLAS